MWIKTEDDLIARASPDELAAGDEQNGDNKNQITEMYS